MTNDEIAKLRAVCEAATDGPWTFDGLRLRSPGGYAVLTVSGYEAVADTAFIAAARTALPALLDEVERLRFYETTSAADVIRDRDRLRALLGEALAIAESEVRRTDDRDRLAAIREEMK